MEVLFGCEQCRPPAGTDLTMLMSGIWALLTFSIAGLAAWMERRGR
jgi:hypothetical protein